MFASYLCVLFLIQGKIANSSVRKPGNMFKPRDEQFAKQPTFKAGMATNDQTMTRKLTTRPAMFLHFSISHSVVMNLLEKTRTTFVVIVTADILFIKYTLSNTIYQIPFIKYHLSNTFIKYHLSNTIYQIPFIKYHLSNTI